MTHLYSKVHCPLCKRDEFAVEVVKGKEMYRCFWCLTRWTAKQIGLKVEG